MTDQGAVQYVLGEVKALRFDAVRGGAIVRSVMFNGQTPVAPSED